MGPAFSLVERPADQSGRPEIQGAALDHLSSDIGSNRRGASLAIPKHRQLCDVDGGPGTLSGLTF